MPVLVDVGRAISELPKDQTWHRQIKRVYDARRAMIESGEGIDWAMAEALAFGTLVNEGAAPPCCPLPLSLLQTELLDGRWTGIQ